MKQASNQPIKEQKWQAFDTMWALGCFGTAIGAGALFFPIKSSVGGLIPFIAIMIMAFPVTYFLHGALARFVLSSRKEEEQDITGVVEEHMGRKGGVIITFLYFMAICPILWLYGVALINTLISFFAIQLKLKTFTQAAPELVQQDPSLRGIIAIACILILSVIVLYGRDVVVKVMSYLVYPFITSLIIITLCLIPYWSDTFIVESLNIPVVWTGETGLLLTLVGGISIMVFSFNHSPIVSSFVVANREKYRHLGSDVLEKKVCRTEAVASTLMVVVLLFFAISCALTLSPTLMAEAKAENLPILPYLANHFNNSGNTTFLSIFFQWAAPIIAIIAIFKSFFGHYLGALEGLNGLILKLMGKPVSDVNMKLVNLGSMLFIMCSTLLVAWLNPSILGLIDVLGAPLIAMLLCILPLYAFYRIPYLKKYRSKSDWWVLFIGVITIFLSIKTIITSLLS